MFEPVVLLLLGHMWGSIWVQIIYICINIFEVGIEYSTGIWYAIKHNKTKLRQKKWKCAVIRLRLIFLNFKFNLFVINVFTNSSTQGYFLDKIWQIWIHNYPSPIRVAKPRLDAHLYFYLPLAVGRNFGCSFPSCVNAMWNVTRTVKNLNSRRSVHVLRRYTLPNERFFIILCTNLKISW